MLFFVVSKHIFLYHIHFMYLRSIHQSMMHHHDEYKLLFHVLYHFTILLHKHRHLHELTYLFHKPYLIRNTLHILTHHSITISPFHALYHISTIQNNMHHQFSQYHNKVNKGKLLALLGKYKVPHE